MTLQTMNFAMRNIKKIFLPKKGLSLEKKVIKLFFSVV
jgi:hypothetical protein